MKKITYKTKGTGMDYITGVGSAILVIGLLASVIFFITGFSSFSVEDFEAGIEFIGMAIGSVLFSLLIHALCKNIGNINRNSEVIKTVILKQYKESHQSDIENPVNSKGN